MKYSIVLFANSKAESGYLAYVEAADSKSAVAYAMQDLRNAYKSHGERLDMNRVTVSYIFEGHHPSSQFPGCVGWCWKDVKHILKGEE